MIDLTTIRGGDGATACPARPVDPPRPRFSLPAHYAWEDTYLYDTRDRDGKRTQRICLIKHVWATKRRWARLDVNHGDWQTFSIGPFVIAWKVEH